jgi:hypothetical protein
MLLQLGSKTGSRKGDTTPHESEHDGGYAATKTHADTRYAVAPHLLRCEVHGARPLLLLHASACKQQLLLLLLLRLLLLLQLLLLLLLLLLQDITISVTFKYSKHDVAASVLNSLLFVHATCCCSPLAQAA